MGLKLINFEVKTRYENIRRTVLSNPRPICRKCDKIIEEKQAVTKTAKRNQKYYHIACARENNLTNTEVWWNRINKYKRMTILNQIYDKEIEVIDQIDSISQQCYRKLSNEVKFILDIHYLKEVYGK